MLNDELRNILEINEVSKTFRSEQGDTHVLDSIDLSVKEGDFTTVIGPSGCGKSTLLKIIAGLDRTAQGEKGGASFSRERIYFSGTEIIPLAECGEEYRS